MNISMTVVPNELSVREPSFTTVVAVGLIVGFLLISIAKLVQSNVYVSLLTSYLKTAQLQPYLKESYPLNKGGSILLALNYFVSSSVLLYVLSGFEIVHLSNELGVIFTLPAIALFWSIVTLWLAGIITGERHYFAGPMAMKLIGAELLGVVYFVLAVVCTLYTVDDYIVLNIVIWSFVVETLIRFFKSIVLVSAQGVSWYYIILYFCTLEILPLFVAYYVIVKGFG